MLCYMHSVLPHFLCFATCIQFYLTFYILLYVFSFISLFISCYNMFSFISVFMSCYICSALSQFLCLAIFFLSYLSRSLADRWGTTVDFTTSFLHSSRFSAFRSVMFHGRPVHSLMLSSHRFLCLPLRLPP